METMLSLAHWAPLCVTYSGVISTVYIRNSLWMLPVLVQLARNSINTLQRNAVLCKGMVMVGGWIPSPKCCGISCSPLPGIPSSPRTPPAHPGYLLALAQLHTSICVLCMDPADPACVETRCAACITCMCKGHGTHAGGTTASLLIPRTRQSKLPGLCSDCSGCIQGRLRWMNAGVGTGRVPVLPMGVLWLPRGKHASGDDLVLKRPGQAPPPGSDSELGTHSTALPECVIQNITACNNSARSGASSS